MILGEFGSHVPVIPDFDEATRVAVEMARQAMDAGMAGWLYWTYDTHEQDGELWHAMTKDGKIFSALTEILPDLGVK